MEDRLGLHFRVFIKLALTLFDLQISSYKLKHRRKVPTSTSSEKNEKIAIQDLLCL